MRVHFLVPSSNYSLAHKPDATLTPLQEGSVIISSAIAAVVNCEVICYDLRFDPSIISSATKDINDNDIICITAIGDSYRFLKENLVKIKDAYPNTIIILGGNLVSTSSEVLLEYLPIDFIVVGKAYDCLPELVRRLVNKESLAGLSIINKLGMGRRHVGILYSGNTPNSLSESLLYDYSLWNSKFFNVREMDSIALSSQFGCPHFCGFCANTAGRTLVSYPVANFKEKIIQISERYKFNNIVINDPTFNNGDIRAISVANVIGSLGFNWSCSLRVQNNPKLLYKSLKENSCTDVFLGVESFDQRILDTNNKNITVDAITRCLDEATNAGLNLTYFLILGLPGETSQSLKSIVDLVDRYDFKPRTFFAFPIPGTSLFQSYCRSKKFAGKDELELHENILLTMSDYKYDGNDYPLPFENLGCSLNEIIDVMKYINKKHLAMINSL